MRERFLENGEEDLLLQISKGDETAFKILFKRYTPHLHSYIFSFVKSSAIAEELAMDVFMKLWLGRDLLVQIKNFDGFLFRVAYNKTIDFLRSVARDEKFKNLLFDEIKLACDVGADERLINQEYEAKLREAIDLLSPQRKKVYKLSTEENLTHSQIAIKLNITKSTVNNHIVEARSFIKNYLSDKLDIAMLLLIFAKI